jgi:hypothetical protein
MKKGAVKLVVFNGEDFCYWKNRTHNYLLSQGHSMLVAMWLTPPTLLTHLFWSLLCLPCVQLLMSSTRASPTTRSPCWRGSSVRCTYSSRIGGDLLGAVSSAATPVTSSPTVPRGRYSTSPTSTTTTTGMTPATRRG